MTSITSTGTGSDTSITGNNKSVAATTTENAHHHNGGRYTTSMNTIISTTNGTNSNLSDSSITNKMTSHNNNNTLVSINTNKSNNDNHNHRNLESDEEEEIRRISQLSNTALENLANQMIEKSQALSLSLTEQLSTTVSGQHLLHIGTLLDTCIPPNMNAFLQHNQPILSVTEQYESTLLLQYDTIQQYNHQIQAHIQRYNSILNAIQFYQDLMIVEQTTVQIQSILQQKQQPKQPKQQQREQRSFLSMVTQIITSSSSSSNDDDCNNDDDNTNKKLSPYDSMFVYSNTFERTAMMVLTLSETLKVANMTLLSSSSSSNSNQNNNNTSNHNNHNNNNDYYPMYEYEQFISKLGPRIRRIENDTIHVLNQLLELILQDYTTIRQNQHHHQQQQKQNDDADINKDVIETKRQEDHDNSDTGGDHNVDDSNDNKQLTERKDNDDHDEDTNDIDHVYLLVIGNLIRSLIMIGHQRDIELIFIKIIIQPIYKQYLIPRLIDEHGTRGECKNLLFIITTIINEIKLLYQPLLIHTELMLSTTTTTTNTNAVDVDLITNGIWVPFINTLMNDVSLRMSIFSPGIANILQTNYTILVDHCLVHFAKQLLTSNDTSNHKNKNKEKTSKYDKYMYMNHQSDIVLSKQQIHQIQQRIYQHPITNEFMKRWNLPIYYQLRFGECCNRINTMIDITKKYGWSVTISSIINTEIESSEREQKYTTIRQNTGLELLLFMELYDTIMFIWQPNIIIKPLTNRFLRGVIQIIGRIVAFIKDGLDGKLLFGNIDDEPIIEENTISNHNTDTKTISTADESTILDSSDIVTKPPPLTMARKPYNWGESESDVASVMWELSIIESIIRTEYVSTVCDAILPHSSDDDENDDTTTTTTAFTKNNSQSELKELVRDALIEASELISPIIDYGWNTLIVNMIISKCSLPISAVKGVAATYRMTNRPPPTMSSPFVITILRPLREFDTEFNNRVPKRIGTSWKHNIVSSISDKYAIAVDDLITTVQRAEESLMKRKGRAATIASNIRSGNAISMSDGEKVKLQLYLDYQTYIRSVQEVGIDPLTIDGINKLGTLTKEGETILQMIQKK